MSRYAEKNVAISGVGQSEIYRKPEVLPFELAVRACERAIADAGLQPEDIDGASVWPATPSGTASGFASASIPDIATSLGLKLNWWAGADNAAQLSPIMEAVAAISAGYVDHVLCWRAVGERWIPRHPPAPGGRPSANGWMDWIMPYRAPSAAIWCGIHAST